MPQGTFSFQRYPAFYIRLQLIYAKLAALTKTIMEFHWKLQSKSRA